MGTGAEAGDEEFWQFGFWDADLCQVVPIQGEPKAPPRLGSAYRRRRVRVVSDWEERPCG